MKKSIIIVGPSMSFKTTKANDICKLYDSEDVEKFMFELNVNIDSDEFTLLNHPSIVFIDDIYKIKVITKCSRILENRTKLWQDIYDNFPQLILVTNHKLYEKHILNKKEYYDKYFNFIFTSNATTY